MYCYGYETTRSGIVLGQMPDGTTQEFVCESDYDDAYYDELADRVAGDIDYPEDF